LASTSLRWTYEGILPSESDHKLARLSIFFPAYNDALSLTALIERTFEVAAACAETFEVVVVNDGSADDTGAVLMHLASRYGPTLRVITHPENRGYGAALRTGFEHARYDVVFYTDGDGQYDVGELPELIGLLTPDVGLVNGFKLQRSDPWHRICIGWMYNRFARTLFSIRLRDIDCDFRLIRRDVLRALNLRSDTGSICVELVRGIELSACAIAEVGVHHYPRLYGRSQFFRFRSLLTTFRQLLALYWRLVILPQFGKDRAYSASKP
jgi:glycosyltransferase involved in cell wall biosynthesis